MISYNHLKKQPHNHISIYREVIRMKKTIEEINATMKELAEYTAMKEELTAQIEALQDQVKAYMTETGVDEVIGENGEKATFRSVISNRFDSTAFKKDFLDIYKEYTKRTEYKRFTFAR